MATVDLTANTVISQVGHRKYVATNEIDFSLTSRAATDVLQLIDVVAGVRVDRIVVHVKTAEGGTLTFDCGDGTDPNGYLDAVNGNSAAYTSTISGSALGYTEGKIYAAADTIDITLDDAADAALIRVMADITDFSRAA